MAKVTTESLITRFEKVHGKTYNYKFVNYRGSKNQVIILCYKHGLFKQLPYNHLEGSGCPRCKAELIGNIKRRSVADFIEEASIIHKNKYDYSCVGEIKSKFSVVDIICPIHGIFKQSVNNHLRTTGCQECGKESSGLNRRSSLFDFISKSSAVHGSYYDYSKIVYEGSRKNVIIVCPEHGDFSQNPHIHMVGSGCPACNSTGFVSNKPANFYIATNGFLTKVGITNKHPTLRLKDVSNSAKSNFELIEYFSFENGRDALSLETYMLQKLNSNYEVCNTYFDGSKECFHDVPYQFIQQNVGKFLLTI